MQYQQPSQQFQPFPQQMLPNFGTMPMMMGAAPKKTSLYLGDLEEQVDDQIIFQRFKTFGNIQSIKVFRSQRRKDCAHAVISFATEQQAEKAKKEMNHEKLLTREIRVLWYNPGNKPATEANIFLKSVPEGITAKFLEDKLCEKFGTVESLKLSENNYGYVQFEKKESSEQCLLRIKEISEQIVCERYQQKGERIDVRRNLYMKNLMQGTPEAVKEELSKMLKEFGEITSMVVRPAKIQEQEKLFAFVCFDSYETAKKVMEAWNNQDVFGTGESVYVSWAEPKNIRLQKLRDMYLKQGNDTIIFTKNIKATVENDMLQKCYEKYGKVIRAVVKEPTKAEGKSYKPTKFGYIYFENKDDAKKAQMNAVKDEELKELYEDSEVYVNFLLNKAAYGRYKNKQKVNTQKENLDMPMGMQQFQQFMMMMMNMMMNPKSGNPMGQMPMMGGHQQQRHNRQMGGGQRNETNRQFRQNQQNYQRKYDHQQQPPQMNMNMMGQPPMMPQAPMMGQPPMMPQNHMMPPQNQMMEQGMMPQQRPQMGMPPMGMPGMGMPGMPMGMPGMMPQMPMQQMPMQQMPMQMPQQPKPQMPQQPQHQPEAMQQQQQVQPQAPLQPVQFKSVQELKTNLNHFLSLDQNSQRKILGEMLFPKVKVIVNDDVLAPKITGMLIDFEVFEVQDILEMLENEGGLKEQIKEAMDLINTQSQ